MNDIKELINERAKTHGNFNSHANISQEMKDIMRGTAAWLCISNTKKECLEMIVHKIARALNGDSEFEDHYKDIQGYAEGILIEIRRNKAFKDMMK